MQGVTIGSIPLTVEKNILSPVALSLRSEEGGGGKGLFFLNDDMTERDPGYYARRRTEPRAQKVGCLAAHEPELSLSPAPSHYLPLASPLE